MDSDLAWVNGKRPLDKADAMLTLSSAVKYREPFTISMENARQNYEVSLVIIKQCYLPLGTSEHTLTPASLTRFIYPRGMEA